MTVIEIRPHGRKWKAYEGPGVEPVFATKEGAISYSQERHRSGEIRLQKAGGETAEVITFGSVAERLT